MFPTRRSFVCQRPFTSSFIQALCFPCPDAFLLLLLYRCAFCVELDPFSVTCTRLSRNTGIHTDQLPVGRRTSSPRRCLLPSFPLPVCVGACVSLSGFPSVVQLPSSSLSNHPCRWTGAAAVERNRYSGASNIAVSSSNTPSSLLFPFVWWSLSHTHTRVRGGHHLPQ